MFDRKRLRGILSFAFLALSIPSLSFAGDLHWAFERLKSFAENYQAEGAVCEQVAKLRLEDEYDPSLFRIETGLIYSSGVRQNMGELDLIVVRNEDRQAVLVGEVKCWSHLHDAVLKARKQRARFINLMRNKKPIELHRNIHHRFQYEAIRFDLMPDFVLISQDGGDQVGFDRTLGFSRNEMHELRQMMLDCQRRGDCPSPVL